MSTSIESTQEIPAPEARRSVLAPAATAVGPNASLPVFAWRSGALDARSRSAIADRLASAVVEAARLRASAPASGASRSQVIAARGRLLDLEHLLRSGVPMSRAAERRIMTLLDRMDGGAYGAGGSRVMHDDAEAACGAAGSVSPFH